jgi:hypothetical protein
LQNTKVKFVALKFQGGGNKKVIEDPAEHDGISQSDLPQIRIEGRADD